MTGRPDPRRLGDRPLPAEGRAAAPRRAEEKPQAQQHQNPSSPDPGPAESTERGQGKDSRTFQRDLFLLKLVAFVLVSQMALYAMGTATCAIRGASQPHPAGSVCSRIDDDLESAFTLALNTLLALLGGKAMLDRSE